jgi:hypothetical protein
METYSSLVEWADSHFPGELGQVCHGKSWCDGFLSTVLMTLEDHIECWS